MAHPLNRPRFDAAAGRVVEGYGVLQPRVTPSLPVGREGSLFQRVFSSMSGIDPYAAAVSDVYQDLFGEGSYTGKGIYDVDAFEAALAGRVPELDAAQPRPVRGRVRPRRPRLRRRGRRGVSRPLRRRRACVTTAGRAATGSCCRGSSDAGPSGRPRSARAGVPAIGRWKMLDNLRRTLSAPAAVLALLAGWALPFDACGSSGPASSSSTIVLPTLIPVVGAIVPRRAGVTVRSHLGALGADLRLALTQSAVLMLTFLAHQAWLMGDAIVRTLVRLFVTRRHLLEWVPAAQATIGPRLDLARLLSPDGRGARHRRCWRWSSPGSRGTADVAAGGCRSRRSGSPRRRSRAGRACRRSSRAGCRCRRPTRGRLRLTARRTWRFFETFVTPADHMLPPDNFQEDPEPVLAHRTSPTNHRPLSPVGRERARLRMDRNRRGGRAAGGDARDHERPGRASAAISTIGTTRAICGRSIRSTSPRSTAAIWPDT